MHYNPNSEFEMSPQTCPDRCDECQYFMQMGVVHYCIANGVTAATEDYSDPSDRTLPMPLSCPWWYKNKIFSTMSVEIQEDYRERRLHEIAAKVYSSKARTIGESKRMLQHLYRRGGQGRIDFDEFPEAKAIYDNVKQRDGVYINE